jgi:hypothetical protein
VRIHARRLRYLNAASGRRAQQTQLRGGIMIASVWGSPPRCRVASFALVLTCFDLSVARQVVAQECSKNVYAVETQDPATLNLSDGDHVIGSVQTANGLWQIHISAKAHVLAAPRFSVAGKDIRPIPQSQVPTWVQGCARQMRQTGGASSVSNTRPTFIHAVANGRMGTIKWTYTQQCWKTTPTSEMRCISIVCSSIDGGPNNCQYFLF